jgi:hypothetical protein
VAEAHRWVILIHQIPPKPDYLRVKIGRRLARLGAVPIKNSVYVLPAGESTVEDLQWVAREIVGEGGEASVCRASFVEGLTDESIEALFLAARGSDYEEITAAARAELRVLTPKRAEKAEDRARARSELGRLQRRVADVVAIDFFGAAARTAAEDAIGLLESRLRVASPAGGRSGAREEDRTAAHDPREVHGRVWVTREGIFVDRIASAWLIRRFLDATASFKFVPAEGYVPAAGELRFDMFEAEYTHEGDRCTFETLVARFGLQADVALRAVAEIVHDIDVKDGKYGRPEVAGVERLLVGIAATYPADAERVIHGGALFDALYESFGRGAERARTSMGRRRA